MIALLSKVVFKDELRNVLGNYLSLRWCHMQWGHFAHNDRLSVDNRISIPRFAHKLVSDTVELRARFRTAQKREHLIDGLSQFKNLVHRTEVKRTKQALVETLWRKMGLIYLSRLGTDLRPARLLLEDTAQCITNVRGVVMMEDKAGFAVDNVLRDARSRANDRIFPAESASIAVIGPVSSREGTKTISARVRCLTTSA